MPPTQNRNQRLVVQLGSHVNHVLRVNNGYAWKQSIKKSLYDALMNKCTNFYKSN